MAMAFCTTPKDASSWSHRIHGVQICVHASHFILTGVRPLWSGYVAISDIRGWGWNAVSKRLRACNSALIAQKSSYILLQRHMHPISWMLDHTCIWRLSEESYCRAWSERIAAFIKEQTELIWLFAQQIYRLTCINGRNDKIQCISH